MFKDRLCVGRFSLNRNIPVLNVHSLKRRLRSHHSRWQTAQCTQRPVASFAIIDLFSRPHWCNREHYMVHMVHSKKNNPRIVDMCARWCFALVVYQFLSLLLRKMPYMTVLSPPPPLVAHQYNILLFSASSRFIHVHLNDTWQTIQTDFNPVSLSVFFTHTYALFTWHNLYTWKAYSDSGNVFFSFAAGNFQWQKMMKIISINCD